MRVKPRQRAAKIHRIKSVEIILALANPHRMDRQAKFLRQRHHDTAARAAHEAFASWRATPVEDRIQPLFRFKMLLEERFEDISAVVTLENGKTLAESRGSVRRGIQMVEVACGAPSLLMGQTLEDVASGIDCESTRQPVGVFAAISKTLESGYFETPPTMGGA